MSQMTACILSFQSFRLNGLKEQINSSVLVLKHFPVQFLCFHLQSSRRFEVDPSCLKCTSEYFYKNQPQMSAVTNVTVNLNHSQLFPLPSRKLL